MVFPERIWGPQGDPKGGYGVPKVKIGTPEGIWGPPRIQGIPRVDLGSWRGFGVAVPPPDVCDGEDGGRGREMGSPQL